MNRRNRGGTQRGWGVLWGLMFLAGALTIAIYGVAQYRLGNIRAEELLGGATRTPAPAPTATRSVTAVLQDAETAYEKGDYRGAINVYEQALRRQPNDANIIHRIARMQVYMGQAQRAEQRLVRALQNEPGNPLLRATLCLALNWQSKLTEAQRECEAALRADPNNPLIVAYAAEAQTDVNDRRTARTNILRAAELSPRDPEVLRVLGYYYEQTGAFQNAIDTYGESLGAVPGQPHVLLALGRSYLGQGSRGRAIQFFKRATEMDPNFAEAWERYAEQIWQYEAEGDGRFNIAQSAFAKAESLDPQRPTIYTKRATMNTSRLRWDSAIDDFQTAITITRQISKTLTPFDYYFMGYVYQQQQNCTAARRSYQSAIAAAQGDEAYIARMQNAINSCRGP